MAGENLQYIFSALSQVLQPELTRQWNRTTYLLGAINAVPGAISEGFGKNTQFAVEFSGATAQSVAEGSDVAASEYNSDLDVPATFPWATYRSSFQLTEQEIDAAKGSMGSPDELRALFAPRILSCGAVIARQIESDALTGTGVDSSGNPALIGIFGGAVGSGLYGGLNPLAYPEWVGNILANGGVSRTLTTDLMDQADANIFTACSEPWDLIMTTAGVVRKYNGVFTGGSTPSAAMTRMNDNPNGPMYGLGGRLDEQGQVDSIFYRGKRVFRNPVAPTGKIAFLNTRYLQLKYLPHTPSMREKEFFEKVGVKGQSGTSGPMQATGIPARVTVLAKTGDSVKVTMRVTCALATTRRNAHAVLQDVSES